MGKSKTLCRVLIPVGGIDETMETLGKMGIKYESRKDLEQYAMQAIEITNMGLRKKKVRPLIPENVKEWTREQIFDLLEITERWESILHGEAYPDDVPRYTKDIDEWWQRAMLHWQQKFNGASNADSHRPEQEEHPRKYKELDCREVRPIRNEEEYQNALERIRQIFLARPGGPLENELGMLEDLTEIYELRNHPILRGREEKEPTAEAGKRPIRDERDYRDALERLDQLQQAETGTDLENEQAVILDMLELYELKNPRMPKGGRIYKPPKYRRPRASGSSKSTEEKKASTLAA